MVALGGVEGAIGRNCVDKVLLFGLCIATFRIWKRLFVLFKMVDSWRLDGIGLAGVDNDIFLSRSFSRVYAILVGQIVDRVKELLQDGCTDCWTHDKRNGVCCGEY